METCLRPTINTVSPLALPTPAGSTLELTGTNFQLSGGQPPTVRIGASACAVTSSSPGQLRCTIPAGDTTEDIVVTNALGQASLPRPIARSAPSLVGVTTGGGLPTRGGPLELVGRDFGLSPSVSVDGVACPTTSTTHTSIRCQAPPGSGMASVAVTSPSGLASNTMSVAYRAPSLTGVSAVWDEGRAAWRIDLQGIDLGPPDAALAVTVGDAACVVLPCSGQAACDASHEARSCVVSSAAGTFDVGVMVGGQASNRLPVSLPAREISVSGGPFATAGGTLLTLVGSGFGATQGTVQIGGAACAIVQWTDTIVRCSVPAGQGTGLRVQLRTAGGVAFPEVTIQYAPPAVTSSSPITLGTTGGQRLDLSGQNFGLTATVTVGSLPAPVVAQSHVLLRVDMPPVAGTDIPVVVTAGGQASSTYFISTFPPAITSAAVQWVDGRPVLTLNGLHFGDAPGNVRVDESTFLAPLLWTQTQVRVHVAPSAETQRFDVVRGGQTSNLFSMRVAPAPAIGSVTPPVLPADGGSVEVFGRDFLPGGQLVVDGEVCVGGEASDTRITCTLAPGTSDAVVQVRRADGAVSNALVVPRQRPSINAVNPNRLTTAGGASVTIDGVGFPAGAAVLLGTDTCTVVSATSSRIVCTAPAQPAGIYPVTVAAGALRSQSALSIERLACEPGTAGTVTCAPCPEGSFSAGDGAATCTSCPGGRVPNAGQTACVLCPTGTFALPGSGACSPCPDGRFADSPGALSCTTCPEGTAPDASRSLCELCSAGTFAAAGDASCTPCPAGTVAPSFGASACSTCPGGRIPGAQATLCVACLVGTFATPGSATCNECPEGTVASLSGSLACEPCVPGTAPNASRSLCELCAPGTFSGEGAACRLCPQGTFSSDGAPVCTRCPLSSAAPPGSAACATCADGVSDDGARCIACGDGFVDGDEACDEGFANADEPDACRLDCTLPFCGDGIVDDGELCDEGDENDDEEPGACRLDCTAPFCGDGIVDPGEECDEGLDNVDDVVDACGTDCTVNVDSGGHGPGDEDADAGTENDAVEPPDDIAEDSGPDDADEVVDDAVDDVLDDALADAPEDALTDAAEDASQDALVDAPSDAPEDAAAVDTDRTDAAGPDATDAVLPPDAPRTDTALGDDASPDGAPRDDADTVEADAAGPVRIGGGSQGGCSAAPGAPDSLWAFLIGAVLVLRRRSSRLRSGSSA